MKKRLPALLLAALLLTGCESVIKNDYLSVHPHVEPSAAPTAAPAEEAAPEASNRNELRGTMLSFVRDWTEQATIQIRGYQGDLNADLAETLQYITAEDPIGAYALDYADAELSGNRIYGSVAVRLVFRRSAAEIDAIVTVSGLSGAQEKIKSALQNFDSALTLRIRSYEDADFPAEIRALCLENSYPVLPEISANVYPQEGETRILELHFSYNATRDEMRTMQKSVNTLLSSASTYMRSGADDTERLQNLLRYLFSRMDYTADGGQTDRPLYDLLHERRATSLGFACVVSAECAQAQIPCVLIEGTRGGEYRAWNRLTVNDEECYIDLMRAFEHGNAELELLSEQTLLAEGYAWESKDAPQD